jgi:hypothetical protein
MVIFASFVFEMGCSRFFSKPESEKKNPPVIDTNSKKDCVKEVREQVSKYFSTETSADTNTHLEHSSQCLKNIIDDFKRDVKPNERNAYSVKDLKRFIEKYFVKDSLSDDFVAEAMELKKALIGGDSEEWTMDELSSVKSLIDVLKSTMKELEPYKQVLLLHQIVDVRRDEDQKILDDAIRILSSVGKKVIRQVHLNSSDYSLTQFQRFLTALGKGQSEDSQLKHIEKYFDIAESVKILLFGKWQDGHQPNSILEEEWDIECLMLKLAIVYKETLLNPKNFFSSDFELTELLTSNVIDILFRSLKLKQQRSSVVGAVFLLSEVNQLIDQLESHGMYRLFVSTQALKTTIPLFISRFLDENRRSDIHEVEWKHLEVFQKEFNGYNSVAKNIIKMTTNNIDFESIDVSQSFTFEELKSKFIAFSASNEDAFKKNSWEQFKKLFDTKGHLTKKEHLKWDSHYRLVIGSGADEETLSIRDLMYTNIYRVASQMLIRGLTDDSERRVHPTIITRDEIRLGYKIFEVFGTDIKAFDSRNLDSATRTAKEADLFTFSANGDGQVQLQELVEELALLIGGGLYFEHELMRVLISEGCSIDRLDFFKNRYIKTDCAKTVIFKNASALFSHLPRFSKILSQETRESFDSFFESIMKVSKMYSTQTNSIQVNLLETSDFRMFSILLSYIEILYGTFDEDQNNLLDENEVERSSQLFSNFVIESAKDKLKQSNPVIFGIVANSNEFWVSIEPYIYSSIAFKGVIPDASSFVEQVIAMEHKKISNTPVDKSQIFDSLKSYFSKAALEGIKEAMIIINKNPNYGEIERNPIDRARIVQIFQLLSH